jgi:hypothetical protein
MDNLPPCLVYEVQELESFQKSPVSVGAAHVPPSNPLAANSKGGSGPGAPAHGNGAPACTEPSAAAAAASSAAAGRCQHADAASSGGEPSSQTSEVTLPPLPVKVGEGESAALCPHAGMLPSVCFCYLP